MHSEQYINKVCDDLVKRIEELRYFFKSANRYPKEGIPSMKLNAVGKERENVLKSAIREAICELEKTKTSFKSKKIKVVREKLIKIVEKK